METSSYKQRTVSRGLTYNFYHSPPQANKPTLLLLHGFPSSSYDWHKQVPFFEAQGFGLIVPDMLGYAGTDRPTDPAAYVGTALAQDMVDLLDAVDVPNAVVLAHDWGSRVASRLANLHPARITALAFLALGYLPPAPPPTVEDQAAAHGREIFGYWDYFSEPGADAAIERNMDSLMSLLFVRDPGASAAHLGPAGATKAWIEGGQTSPPAAYISAEEKQQKKEMLLKGGMAAPLCWYKVQTSGLAAEDAKRIPADAHFFSHPTFFGACKHDPVCLPEAGIAQTTKYATGPVTIRTFDADHWVYMSHAQELNAALLEWIGGLDISSNL